MISRVHREDLEAIVMEYGKNKAPVVVAKGQGELAEMILEEARRHGVYIAKDPQLVAMLSELDLEQEIPERLYTTVAVILSWAYWLKGMRPGDEVKDSN